MSDRTLREGSTFGRFEILSRIARGGMAEVWLAQSHGVAGFQKRVVLKTMLPALAERPEFVKMFINEAAVAARLNHPNIVPIFDLGCFDGTYFIAMEYVPGRSLRQILKRLPHPERLPLWLTLRVIAAVCDGLQYVHDFADADGRSLGLVHCDVSPENVLVSFTGHTELVDFGIATITARESLMDSDPEVLKGKYHYMAPERVGGQPLDRRSDVYAVGVTLYELLTGVRPYRGQTPIELLAAAAQGNALPPSSFSSQISPELDDLVLRAFCVDPDARYQEAADLARDLREYLAGTGDDRRDRDVGLFVSSLFPGASDIPKDVEKELREGRHGTARPSPRAMRAAEEVAPPSDASPPSNEQSMEIILDSLVAMEVEPAPPTLRREPPPAAPPPPKPAPLPPASSPSTDGRDRRSAFWDGTDSHLRSSGDALATKGQTNPDVFAVPRRSVFPSSDIFPTARKDPSDGPVPSRSFGRGARLRTPSAAAEPVPKAHGSRAALAAQHFERGFRYFRQRNYRLALEEWEAAFALDEGNATYRVNVQRLRKLLSD